MSDLQKSVIFSCITLASLLIYIYSNEEMSKIKQENNALYAYEVIPYDTREDCYYVEDGRGGSTDCTTIEYYTPEDERILDERKALLRPWSIFSNICIFTGIIGLIYSIAYGRDAFNSKS